MKLRNILFLIGAASLGLFSCSTEIPETPVAGETSLTLFLSMADPKTKADAPIATAEELNINNCHVAIFDDVTGERIFMQNLGDQGSPTSASPATIKLENVRTFGKETKDVRIFVIANAADNEKFNDLTNYGAYQSHVEKTIPASLVKVGELRTSLTYGTSSPVTFSISLIQLTVRIDFLGIEMPEKNVQIESTTVKGINTQSNITFFSDVSIENTVTSLTTNDFTFSNNRFYTYEGASLELNIVGTVDGGNIVIPTVNLSDKLFVKGNRYTLKGKYNPTIDVNVQWEVVDWEGNIVNTITFK